MGLFDFFSNQKPPQEVQDNPSIRQIVASIDAMPEAEARYLAAFAYILGRVAHADAHVSEEEVQKMEEIVTGFAEISQDQAILIVQIAKSQNLLMGGTDNYLVVREFKKMAEREQKEALLHCLFGVAGSDDDISSIENDEIRKIANELGLTPSDFLEVRLHYRDKLSILKNLP